MQLPSYVLNTFNRLEDAGYKSFIVGGAVRDFLLGESPYDYDIATEALPEEVLKLFEKTAPTGKNYGTVTVLESSPIEVTTFRKDGPYTDGRHPLHVSFSKTIDDDLKRRDFTINAIAYSPKTGFYDPLFGKNDLEKRKIKAVGNPSERFKEDALRILRGIRFLSKLGEDWAIDQETILEMIKSAHLIKNISKERIVDEIKKLLLGNAPEHALYTLQLLSKKAFDEELDLTEVNISNLPKSFELRLSRVLKNNPWLQSWLILSNKEKKRIKKILTDYPLYNNDFELRQLCFNLGRDYLDDWLLFRSLKPKALELKTTPIFVNDLQITGRDIQKLLGLGPVVGTVLDDLAALVREDPSLNKKELLIQIVKERWSPKT